MASSNEILKQLFKEKNFTPNENLIQNLRGFEGKNLTRSVLLAFACDPERWFTGAYIKIAFFENDADILYQDEIHGSLIKQVDESLSLIYQKYMKAFIRYDGIYRQEFYFFSERCFQGTFTECGNSQGLHAAFSNSDSGI